MADSSDTWSLGTRSKCDIAAISENKIAKCVRVNRWRKSLAIKFAAIGSANKIAWCVARFREK